MNGRWATFLSGRPSITPGRWVTEREAGDEAGEEASVCGRGEGEGGMSGVLQGHSHVGYCSIVNEERRKYSYSPNQACVYIWIFGYLLCVYTIILYPCWDVRKQAHKNMGVGVYMKDCLLSVHVSSILFLCWAIRKQTRRKAKA